MQRRTQIRIVLGAGLVLAAGLLTWSGAQAPPAPQGFVTGPSELVEFSCILTRSEPGHPTQTGRYFRGPDGSDRHEAGPAVDVVELIDIKNIARETNYIWDKRVPQAWHAYPMQVGEQGRGFPRSMPKSALTPMPNGQPMQYEGLDVVEWAKGGLTMRRAPALNFFIVDRLLPNGGRVTCSNIHVGPVDQVVAALGAPRSGPGREPLFEPPYTDAIEWRNTPNGIIRGEHVGGLVPGAVPPPPRGR